MVSLIAELENVASYKISIYLSNLEHFMIFD